MEGYVFLFHFVLFQNAIFCSKMAYISPIQELFSFEDQTNTKFCSTSGLSRSQTDSHWAKPVYFYTRN